MNTNTKKDVSFVEMLEETKKFTDYAAITYMDRIEEYEERTGRQFTDFWCEHFQNQLKISRAVVQMFQRVYKDKNKMSVTNGDTGNNESTLNVSILNKSNGNPNQSVNKVTSTHSQEPTQQTMENDAQNTLRDDSLFENQVSDEEYSRNHVANKHINGHDPKSANVTVIRSSRSRVHKTPEPVAGPSGLQQLNTGSESQEMLVDLDQNVHRLNSSESSMMSSKHSSTLYDDREYEDSSNDELTNNYLANKSHEPERKRKKRLDKNSYTNKKQVVVISPVADPNDTRNTDSSIHWGVSIHYEQCKFCLCKQKNLVKHLSEEHPDKENYISRATPPLANRMRRETSNLNRSVTNNWIGICGFCEKKLISKSGWRDHFRGHTGEKLYSCDHCEVEFDTKKAHRKCRNGAVKNIYEKFSNGAMKGFICNLCNFIQISEDRLKQHLRNEHKETSIGNKYQQIDLILDEKQPDEEFETNWKFVEERLRFKCGLDYCEFHADEIQALQAHVTSKHRRCVRTLCVHCNQLIQLEEDESMDEKYVDHLKLHGNDVYECSLCETASHKMKKIVKHLIDHHRSDQLNVKHFHREDQNIAIETIATEICIQFRCIICEVQLDNLDSIVNHFEALHFGCNIDTSVLILEKIRNQSEQQLTFDPCRWRLRQTIGCVSCKTEPQSMKELVDHCRNIHNFQNIYLKLTQLKLIKVNECPSDRREFMFDRIFFACHYCINGIRPHEFFADIESVHTHWLNIHAKDVIRTPFRFQVSEMAACYYCDSIGPYHSLKHHHVAKHGEFTFCISTIANKNKCALCQFVENSDMKLSKHFIDQHAEYYKMDVFSPLCLAEPILNKLLELNIEEKLVCNHCQRIFDSSAIKQHNSAVHPGKMLNFGRAAESNDINYQIVCSYCNDFKGRNVAQSIEHLLNAHKYEYKCVICPGVCSNDMIEMVNHDFERHGMNIEMAFKKRQTSIRITIFKANFKSLVIFQNGLTLPTNCMGGTQLDIIKELTNRFDSKMKEIGESFEASQ